MEIPLEETQEQEESAQSIVVIKFEAPGSARFDAQFLNVDPYQMLSACGVLELRMKAIIMSADEEAQREAKIAVPEPQIELPGTMRR